jgi:hypothetical protein
MTHETPVCKTNPENSDKLSEVQAGPAAGSPPTNPFTGNPLGDPAMSLLARQGADVGKVRTLTPDAPAGGGDAATTVVARFNLRYTPIKDELERILKNYKGENREDAFFKFLLDVREGKGDIPSSVRPIVEIALSDRQLLRNIDYVKLLEDEEKRFKKSPSDFQSSGLGMEVSDALKLARDLAVRQAGELALGRYQRYVDELNEHLRNGEKILIDITAAQRNLLDEKIQTNQVSKAEAKIYGVVKPDEEHVIWPFNGEYWRDELGFYRQVVESACGR